VITNSNDVAEVYENVSTSGGGWLAVDLGPAPGSALAIGSRLELLSGGKRQSRDVMPVDSYLSQSCQTARFGLGGVDSGLELRVRWSDARRTRHTDLPPGRRVRLWRREPIENMGL